MPPALGWLGASARIGAAALALAVVAAAPAPEIVLALVGVVLLVLGGTAWSRAGPIIVRLAGPLLAVVAARVLAGTAAAAVAAVLVTVGASLRVRVAEATAGLAVFGLAVALLGGASPRVLLAFWLLGSGILLVRRGACLAWRRLTGPSLTPERAPAAPLHSEK